MPPLVIDPPLFNSANPWATTLGDLRALFKCPYTGAVTTRTCLINGFEHDPSVHQYTFFDSHEHSASADIKAPQERETASLNTLGYSPIKLDEYLSYISTISRELAADVANGAAIAAEGCQFLSSKTFIISVTGTVDEIRECWRKIIYHQAKANMPLAMEINLSCPNIPNKPPPAYSSESLAAYFVGLAAEISAVDPDESFPRIPVGIKTPPYTYKGQYDALMSALQNVGQKYPYDTSKILDFITATNTLGSSLVLSPFTAPDSGDTAAPAMVAALHSADGSGIGGLAGSALHPLALGNVLTLRNRLDKSERLKGIRVIGVGGVSDNDGFWRMRSVGAAAVGVGTALGRKGIGLFEEITNGGRV